MKITKSILVGLFFFSVVIANAQKYYSYSDSSENITYPDILSLKYIKFSPLNLAEVEPSFQIGFEYSVNPKLRLQHEIGYISFFNPFFLMFNPDWTQGDPSNGIRVRTTFKFPLKSLDNYYKGRKDYMGVDIMGKYFTYTNTNVDIDRYNYSYFQQMDIKYEKYVFAAHVIFGFENYLNVPNNFVNDYYLGIGIRHRIISNNIPEDSNYESDLSYFDRWQGTMISIMAGYKIGFGVK